MVRNPRHNERSPTLKRCTENKATGSGLIHPNRPDLDQKILSLPDSKLKHFSPQAAGLLRHLEVAQTRVDRAPDYRARREAQRYTNRLRRALRPAPAPVPDWKTVEVARQVQINAIVQWAERREGAGR